MKSYVVRDYEPDFADAEALSALAVADDTRLGDYFHAPLKLVADVQGRIVGFGALTVGSGPCSHCGTLRIHVSKAWRGGEIGNELMQQVLAWADDNGIWRIEATPYAHDDFLAKKRFFERYGFQVEGWKRQAAIRNDGTVVDVCLMARVW